MWWVDTIIKWQQHLPFGSEVPVILCLLKNIFMVFHICVHITPKISWNLYNCPLTLAKERIRPQSHEDQVTKFQFFSMASFFMPTWSKVSLSRNLLSSVTKKFRPGQWLTWKPWGNVQDLWEMFKMRHSLIFSSFEF